MRYYPAFLNLKGKKVFLVGGGAVALRKAKALIEAGAKITMLSREFSSDFRVFAKKHKIQMRRGNALPELKNFSLVIAATSDARLNQKAYERAKRAGIFVNVVDDPKHSTFIVPSTLKRGSLQIAVSTGGKSPLLAKLIRHSLERRFGSEWRNLVEWLGGERIKAKRMLRSQKSRAQYFERLLQKRFRALEHQR